MIVGQTLPFQQKSPFGVSPFTSPLKSQEVKQPEAQQAKPPEEGLTRFLNYYADYSGCGHWRMIWPEQVMNAHNKAVVHGNINFAPAELMATDLRASVSLVLAALTAKGKSVINRIYHLDRGYENLEKKLKKVGAKIRRIN